jgi:hypothetical protein
MGAVLDEALQRAFPKGGTPVRFLQIGGNDGVYQDPLYQHHVHRTFDFEWGHIFEPIPEYFEKLAVNMRPFTYVTCHQFALDNSKAPGKRKFSYVSPEDVERAELPPSSMGIGSFSLSGDGLGNTPYPEAKYLAVREYIRTIEVDTMPVGLLVERYAAANFMITDCEGHDLDLVRGAILDHGFRPKVLQFEYARQDDEVKSTLNALRALGYHITGAGKDYVAELS